MKNKTKKRILIACAILLLLIVLNAIIFTYAKYITTEKGTGQADIAKWSFKIDKNGEETKTIKLINTVNKATLVNGKIAPGTSGEIIIGVDGTGSEVGVAYDIKFENEQNKPDNLYFRYKNQKYSSLSEIEAITGNFLCNEENKKIEYVIFWQWPYETGDTANLIAQNDEIDTQNANKISQYTFDVVATGTQM